MSRSSCPATPQSARPRSAPASVELSATTAQPGSSSPGAAPGAGACSRAGEARIRLVRIATAKVLALVGAAALLTGCSAAPAPAPAPARLSPPIPGDPLDLSVYARKPCELLPASELARFFVAQPGTVSTGTGGPVCTWVPSDTTALTYRASIGTGGLEDIYRRRSRFPAFDATTVHSYPAVHIENVPGHCRVAIGLTDSMLLDVVIDARDTKLDVYNDPCTEADSFAGAVLGYQGHRAP